MARRAKYGRTRVSARTVTKKTSPRKKNRAEIEDGATTTRGVDVRKIQQTIDDLGSSFFKIPEGACTIRILPPQQAFEGDFAYRQDIHYGFEDSSGKQRTVLCLRSVDEDCPVCEFVESLRRTGDKDDEKLANDLRTQVQLLTEVLVRPAKRIRILRLPVTVYREMAGWIADPSIGDFTHPIKGRDLRLNRKGTGFRTRYSCNTLDRCKIGTSKWKRKRHDFSRFASPQLSYRKLVRMLTKQYQYDPGE